MATAQKKPTTETPEISDTITVELDVQEAQLIFSTFEQVPVNGPEGKRVAANVQAKLIQAASVVS